MPVIILWSLGSETSALLLLDQIQRGRLSRACQDWIRNRMPCALNPAHYSKAKLRFPEFLHRSIGIPSSSSWSFPSGRETSWQGTVKVHQCNYICMLQSVTLVYVNRSDANNNCKWRLSTYWNSGKWGAFKQGVETLGRWRKWLILLRKKRHYVFVPLVPQKLNLTVWFYVSRSRTRCSRRMVRCFSTLSVPSERSKQSVVIIPHRIRSSRKCAMLNITLAKPSAQETAFLHFFKHNCCAVYAFQELCVCRNGNVDGWGGVRGSSPPAGRRNWIYSFISQLFFLSFTENVYRGKKNPAWVLGFW